MRSDHLGRTFTLLAVLLILGLGIINLITAGLYGRVNTELMREQMARQQQEAANWGLRLATLSLTAEPLEKRIDELTANLTTNGTPAAIAIYQASGDLHTTWLKPASNDDQEFLAERGKLQALLPRQTSFLPAGIEPCSENALSVAKKETGRIRTQKLGQTRYNIFTVPLLQTAGGNTGQPCVAFTTIVFRAGANILPWPLLSTLLQILTIISITMGGLLLLRIILRPASASLPSVPDTTGAEFVVGSLQSLIDGLQVERAELSRLHNLERQRAAFVEEFNDLIVASIAGGLVVIEHTGYLVVANKQARLMFEKNVDEQELLARNIKYRDYFRAAPRLSELVHNCLKEGTTVVLEEFEALRPDGSPCLLAVTISPLKWRAQDNKAHGALSIITDLTEVMELRRRLRLQENLANLGEMSAGIAHEFKNSLATISGYGQLLQTITSEPSAQNSARALVDEVKHLTQVVTDFLNFARPQQLQRLEFSIKEMLEDCCEAMAKKADSEGVTITMEGEFPTILGDPTLLRRAMLNLIDNGIEAMDAAAKVKAINIRGRVEPEESRLILEFGDTGAGIPSSDLAKIFIPFFTTKSRGYGIGLALVQKIFLAHQGSVTVSSQEGSGSTFICTLPLP